MPLNPFKGRSPLHFFFYQKKAGRSIISCLISPAMKPGILNWFLAKGTGYLQYGLPYPQFLLSSPTGWAFHRIRKGGYSILVGYPHDDAQFWGYWRCYGILPSNLACSTLLPRYITYADSVLWICWSRERAYHTIASRLQRVPRTWLDGCKPFLAFDVIMMRDIFGTILPRTHSHIMLAFALLICN